MDNLVKAFVTGIKHPGIDRFVQANAKQATDTNAKSHANVSRQCITMAIHKVDDETREGHSEQSGMIWDSSGSP